ncbi:MAG: hypothetical protein ABFD77_03875 [Thermotogota bacterium]
MGTGLDLVMMLDLPETVKCPECSAVVPTFFDDYDVAGSVPDANPDHGAWILEVDCHECGHVWCLRYVVEPRLATEEEEWS